MNNQYLVSACGISVICGKESLPGWIIELVNRGGTPKIQLLYGETYA